MRWFLVSLIGMVGTLMVLACIAVLLVRHRIERRNRVDPKVATPAPATWLADPRAAARLHRRLVRIGRAAALVADEHRRSGRFRRAPDQPPIVETALALRAHAVRLDHDLGRSRVLAPSDRRRALARLGAAVTELETAANRLVALSGEVLAPPVLATEAGDVTDLAGQVARLAEAHQALLELDAANGLIAAPTTEPAPPAAKPAAGRAQR